jgi:hypothetical protein
MQDIVVIYPSHHNICRLIHLLGEGPGGASELFRANVEKIVDAVLPKVLLFAL